MADIVVERRIPMRNSSKLPILGFILIKMCLLSFLFLDVIGSMSAKNSPQGQAQAHSSAGQTPDSVAIRQATEAATKQLSHL